jgi:hypothetical protein
MDGDFRDGKKDGRGVYVFANGERYDGVVFIPMPTVTVPRSATSGSISDCRLVVAILPQQPQIVLENILRPVEGTDIVSTFYGYVFRRLFLDERVCVFWTWKVARFSI